MSYQPLPPGGGAAPAGPMPTFHTPPPPAPPTPPAPPIGVRRRGVVGLGVVLLLGGLVAGGVLFVLATKATGEAVKKFARAPVGCTTTLQFEKSAMFTIFVETKGTAIDVGGNCAGNGSSYDRGDGAPPTVTLTLVDAQDKAVTMTDSNAFSYDTGDFKGAAVQQVVVDQPGTYRLTVESKDDNFAIAIGADPHSESRRMKYVGAAAVAAGMLLGVLLMLLGSRRGTPPAPTVGATPYLAPASSTRGVVSPATPFGVPPIAPGRLSPPPPGRQLPPPPPDGSWGAPQF